MHCSNVRHCYHHRPTLSGALRVLPAASGAESKMFLVRCFSLGSSQMASLSLGIWRKLYSRIIPVSRWLVPALHIRKGSLPTSLGGAAMATEITGQIGA